MGESKHLPGPWYVRHAVLSERRGRTEIRTTNGGIGELVAVAVHGEQGAATVDANADVLAAAPQMLEALRLVMALNDNPASRVPGYHRNLTEFAAPLLDPRAEMQVRAAIKAATGGEPQRRHDWTLRAHADRWECVHGCGTPGPYKTMTPPDAPCGGRGATGGET